MCKKHLAVVDLDERRIDEYLHARRRRGRGCRGFGPTARRLLEQLRSGGVVRTATATLADSPVAALLARYEGYLRRERALEDSTIAAYQSCVRAFVMERLDANAAGPDSLRPGHVRDFLLTRVGRMAPRRAQFMATALRSFLRFLFLRGETETDLSFAIPRVRRWRLSSVPRHLPARHVERFCVPVTAQPRRGGVTTRSSCRSRPRRSTCTPISASRRRPWRGPLPRGGPPGAIARRTPSCPSWRACDYPASAVQPTQSAPALAAGPHVDSG